MCYAQALLAAEEAALPTVLCNAATAIEALPCGAEGFTQQFPDGVIHDTHLDLHSYLLVLVSWYLESNLGHLKGLGSG